MGFGESVSFFCSQASLLKPVLPDVHLPPQALIPTLPPNNISVFSLRAALRAFALTKCSDMRGLPLLDLHKACLSPTQNDFILIAVQS